MPRIKILFLGASRLVSLLQRFQDAACDLNIALTMYTFEDKNVWHPVGVCGLARVIHAPPFEHDAFDDFILNFVSRESIDIVIPNIDKATVRIAELSVSLADLGAKAICSNFQVCDRMFDKMLADKVFKDLGFDVPDSKKFPLLAKPRFGRSSKGIVKLNDKEELEFWRKRNDPTDFLIQEFVKGIEYSIDAYITDNGKILGIVPRKREIISDGEVLVSITENVPEAKDIVQKLTNWEKWLGPITIQIIADGKKSWIIECNPRFGSGIPLSIEAGLNIPLWILQEKLGLGLPSDMLISKPGLCMTRFKQEKFLWL